MPACVARPYERQYRLNLTLFPREDHVTSFRKRAFGATGCAASTELLTAPPRPQVTCVAGDRHYHLQLRCNSPNVMVPWAALELISPAGALL